jgi:hypothetical protein
MYRGSDMRDYFFSAPMPDGRQICVSPISRDTFDANQAHELGDDFGYFIYEFDADRPASGIEILAKAASFEAAVRLIDIYLTANKTQLPAASAHSLKRRA